MSHARRREVAIDIADRIGRAADDGAPDERRREWLARGGGQVPADIAEAVRLAPTVLRRPSAVTITALDGFEKPVPVWADAAAD